MAALPVRYTLSSASMAMLFTWPMPVTEAVFLCTVIWAPVLCCISHWQSPSYHLPEHWHLLLGSVLSYSWPDRGGIIMVIVGYTCPPIAGYLSCCIWIWHNPSRYQAHCSCYIHVSGPSISISEGSVIQTARSVVGGPSTVQDPVLSCLMTR